MKISLDEQQVRFDKPSHDPSGQQVLMNWLMTGKRADGYLTSSNRWTQVQTLRASAACCLVPPTVQLKIGHTHRVTWPVVWWNRRYVEKIYKHTHSKCTDAISIDWCSVQSVSWWASVFRDASTCLNQRWNSVGVTLFVHEITALGVKTTDKTWDDTRPR